MIGGLMGSVTGGGGLSTSSSATSGDAKGQSGSGNKQFNFGANPNLGSSQVMAALTNPLFLVAAVVVVVLVFRKK